MIIKSIIILIFILYATKPLKGADLSTIETSGLIEVKKILFDFKPKITTKDAKIWKKMGLNGWELINFLEAANETFDVLAKSYQFTNIDDQIYFLQPGYVISKNLKDLIEYENFLGKNRNKFLNNHAKFMVRRHLLVIPNSEKNTQVQIIKKSHPNMARGFLKVKVVGKEVYFWTVKYSLI